jgi:hypothetical protein
MVGVEAVLIPVLFVESELGHRHLGCIVNCCIRTRAIVKISIPATV